MPPAEAYPFQGVFGRNKNTARTIGCISNDLCRRLYGMVSVPLGKLTVLVVSHGHLSDVYCINLVPITWISRHQVFDILIQWFFYEQKV